MSAAFPRFMLRNRVMPQHMCFEHSSQLLPNVSLQDLMRQQMSLAYRTGDLAKAALLAKKLKPDEDTKKVGGVALPPRQTFASMNALPEGKK